MTSVQAALASPGFTLAEAQAETLAIVNRSGSSFTVAMKMLDRRRRYAMYAVYALARAVDDIADGDGEMPAKRYQLQEWRHEIEAVFKGHPTTTIGIALAGAVQEYSLPKEEFLLLIDGMEMDAEPIVAPTMEELFTYTRRVAGTVGLLSMPIFGAPGGPLSDQFALTLADGLQLTNILRDVQEDARIGRLYLPRELLEEQGIAALDLLADPAIPPCQAVCQSLGIIARQKFQSAKTAAGSLDRRTIRPALMMMGVYEGYLRLLERRQWGFGQRPVRMGKLEKLFRSINYAYLMPS